MNHTSYLKSFIVCQAVSLRLQGLFLGIASNTVLARLILGTILRGCGWLYVPWKGDSGRTRERPERHLRAGGNAAWVTATEKNAPEATLPG